MVRVKNLPIAGKFLTILSAYSVFVIAVALYSANRTTDTGSSFEELRNGPTRAIQDVETASSGIHGMLYHIAQLMIDNTAAEKQADLVGLAQFKTRFGQFIDHATAVAPADDVAEIEDLKSRTLQAVDGACANSIQLATSATTPAAIAAAQAAYLSQCAQEFPPDSDTRALIARMSSENNSIAASVEASAHSTVITTLVLTLIGLAAVMLGSHYTIRSWVVSPIQALQTVMNRLYGGDLHAKVIGAERRDEIGGMARAVQVFKDAGIEKQRLEAETAAQRQAVEAERQSWKPSARPPPSSRNSWCIPSPRGSRNSPPAICCSA